MGVVLLTLISHLCCSSAVNSSPLWTRLVLHHILSFSGCFCALSETNTISSDHWHYEISVSHIRNHYNGQNNLMWFLWASGHGPEKPSMSKGSAVLQQGQKCGCPLAARSKGQFYITGPKSIINPEFLAGSWSQKISVCTQGEFLLRLSYDCGLDLDE